MLFVLEPGSELQEIESQFVEFNSVSHPSLQLVELVLFLLEQGHLEGPHLGSGVEVHVSGVDQVDAAFGHVLEENGPFVEQEKLAGRDLVVLVQVVDAEDRVSGVLVSGQRFGLGVGFQFHESSSSGLG